MNGQLNGPRNAIEIRRLVLPVLHGIESGWNQHPGAADGARLDYVSILVDERVDLDVAPSSLAPPGADIWAEVCRVPAEVSPPHRRAAAR